MAIKIGNSNLTLKVGSTEVTAAYLGSTLVYSGGTPTFNGKWLATYSGGSTSSAECDSSSAITMAEITLENIVSVQIGDCVTSIGDSAFSNCSGLTSIDIPDSVTSIGIYAFYNCSGLTSCTIGDCVTNIGDGAFVYCSGLTSIDIPSGVTSIGSNVFSDCCSLTSVNIPSGVTSIGDYAFRNCSSLTSITVEATTPPTLGKNAFYNTNYCPIYVPSGSVSAYQSASGWSKYASRIQAIP